MLLLFFRQIDNRKFGNLFFVSSWKHVVSRSKALEPTTYHEKLLQPETQFNFIFLLQNPNILTALRPRHGENIAEKSITVCSGLDMVNINLTHFVFANKEDADVSIFE